MALNGLRELMGLDRYRTGPRGGHPDDGRARALRADDRFGRGILRE